MAERLWKKILEGVRTRVPEGNFNAWFQPITPLRLDGSTLWISVPNPVFQEFLEKNYLSLFKEVAAEAGLENLVLKFEENSEEHPRVIPPPAVQVAPLDTTESGKTNGEGDRFATSFQYDFDSFVVGSSNRFAYAACRAVAQNPSRDYNPLYLYGGVGLGKTHLMQSVGREITLNYPNLKVCYLSTERFMNEMISSIAHRQQHEFRDRYRMVDVLLLDDIQFLSGKSGTQEELFHTFNALHDAQKQVILSSDCPPNSLERMEERLRSRFGWGLIADIQPPELETKVAILSRKAEAHNVVVPEEVKLYIADRVTSNIRELEGCFLRLIAFSSFRGKPISISLARETFDQLFSESRQTVTVEAIQKHVAAHYKIKVKDLIAKTNKASIVRPRQVAMYISKELTGASLPEIGRLFGGKHHTTVIHSLRKIKTLMDRDPSFQQEIHKLLESLR